MLPALPLLVTELSVRRCSHLRSWQPMVFSEQQTHFSITPLSLTPTAPPTPFCSFHLTFFLCSLISSVDFSLALLFLSYFPYFHTCAFHSSIVWFCCQPSTLTEDFASLFFVVFFLLSHFLTQFPIYSYSDSFTSPSVFTFSLHLSPLSNFHFSLSTT